MRRLVLAVLVSNALVLGGCAVGLAASAIGMAARSARGEPVSNEHLKPEAVQACSAHAAQFGTVHIIDVEQRTTSKIIVWGTVEDQKERRSFQCSFGTKVTGFTLRSIRPSL